MSFQNGINQLQQLFHVTTPTTTTGVNSSKAGQIEQSAVANRAAANSSSVPDMDGDQTHVSTVGGLVVQALQSSDVRMEKVSSIQQSLATGTYNVSANDVAGKLIRSMQG
ncbi:MAG: flagellar biosynthesis anti-sigma factor FlgM [Acidobacteriaceae bacterium]